jgi:hypothetical protein
MSCWIQRAEVGSRYVVVDSYYDRKVNERTFVLVQNSDCGVDVLTSDTVGKRGHVTLNLPRWIRVCALEVFQKI